MGDGDAFTLGVGEEVFPVTVGPVGRGVTVGVLPARGVAEGVLVGLAGTGVGVKKTTSKVG